MANKKLLLVEDDTNLSKGVIKFLKTENFEVEHVETLKKAKEKNLEHFNLIILDWMLPDGQGVDFLQEIRRTNSHIPVIMLTARTELMDKVIGLEIGANDYITKPFEPRELIARIRVQLRTLNTQAPKKSISHIQRGEIQINIETREVRFKNKPVNLTKMEYDLLKLLIENPGKVFTRDEILNKVWGFENFPTTRTVDTHMLQLRQKFDDSLFETVRGVGYRFVK